MRDDEVAALRAEVERLNKLRVHCEHCGGDYAQTGVHVGCVCQVLKRAEAAEARVKELREALEMALDQIVAAREALSKAERKDGVGVVEDKQPSILLVEDDKAILDMWIEGFQSLGYKFWTAMNTEEALGHNVDLVITDLRIPGEFGRFAMPKWGMKVIEYYTERKIPVIVASSDVGEYRDRIVKLGARIADDKSLDAIVLKMKGD